MVDSSQEDIDDGSCDSSVSVTPAPGVTTTVIGMGRLSERFIATRSNAVYFSHEIADLIEEAYIAGNSLHAISKMEGMPSYGTILRWTKDNSKFGTCLGNARKTRALHFEEKVVEAIEAPRDKDDVPQAKLKMDGYQWLAGVNNPEVYGKRTTVAGDASKPIVFTIITGVPAPTEKQVELGDDGRQVIEITKEVVSDGIAE